MNRKTICIINYGQGNLGSIRNMFLRIGIDAIITDDPFEIKKATHLILPGVGAFDRGMKAVIERGLRSILEEQVMERQIPILGICLGAQLMTLGSEEGDLPGLGWFDAYARRFDFSSNSSSYPVPNIGWRDVRSTQPNTLVEGLDSECRFYFVHSYHMVSKKEDDIALLSSYGYDIVVGMQRNNIYSAQFHPEKSHKFGMVFLRNFANA